MNDLSATNLKMNRADRKIAAFHEIASAGMAYIAEALSPDAKLTLVVYFDGKPEQDIILTDGEFPEVIKAIERRVSSDDTKRFP